jgi:hypothetical protein
MARAKTYIKPPVKLTGGRKKYEPTESQRRIVMLMSSWRMSQEVMCQVLLISRPTLRRAFVDELRDGPGLLKAKLGEKLVELAMRDGGSQQLGALKLALSVVSGVTEKTRTEHTGAGGGPISILSMTREQIAALPDEELNAMLGLTERIVRGAEGDEVDGGAGASG